MSEVVDKDSQEPLGDGGRGAAYPEGYHQNESCLQMSEVVATVCYFGQQSGAYSA